MPSVLLAPTVIESGGCLTANLDREPEFHSVISRFFLNGAVSFCGQTRPGITQQEQQRAEFWNAIFTGQTIGEAHRRIQTTRRIKSITQKENPQRHSDGPANTRSMKTRIDPTPNAGACASSISIKKPASPPNNSTTSPIRSSSSHDTQIWLFGW